MLRRIFVATILLAAFACSDAAGPSDGDDGALTVYSGRSEELVQPLIDAFENETGIEVAVRYGETAELANQILEEGGNSRADVFWAQDAGALGAVAKADLFADLDEDVLDAVPARFRSPDGVWVGTSGRARVLVYNTEQVSTDELPASILGLTDEAWEGRVGWAPTNGSFQAAVTALRVVEGDETAREWLEGMVANDAQAYDGNSAIVQAVASGEIDAGLVNHYYLLEMGSEDPEVTENAANHFFEGGDAGSIVNAAGVGILESATNSEEAEAFVDFLVSRQAGEFFDEEVYEYPLVADLPTPEGLPDLDEIEQPDIDLSDLDDLKGTLEMLRETEAL